MHYRIELCQITKSDFNVGKINTFSNVRATPNAIHQKISNYFFTNVHKIPNFYTIPQGFNGTVRDWLGIQSFDFQSEFGLEIWEQAMNDLLFNQL